MPPSIRLAQSSTRSAPASRAAITPAIESTQISKRMSVGGFRPFMRSRPSPRRFHRSMFRHAKLVVEEDEAGAVARRDAAQLIAEAEELGRGAGGHVQRCLERQVESLDRVADGGRHVEVGAGDAYRPRS